MLLVIIWLVSSVEPTRAPHPTVSPQTIAVEASATSIWNALLERTPVAYAFPLPEPARSPVDGTYAKIDPSWPQWWLCRRCADYRPAGGIWKLQFNQGVARIYYDVTGWRSMASFTATGDRLSIFNDLYCPDNVGEYRWELENGKLQLEVIDDPCSIDLRGKNLSNQPWLACLPPNEATGGSQHVENPPGCEQGPAIATLEALARLPVSVVVHGGDSHYFEKPPDVFAPANSDNIPLPEGIEVSYHTESIPYGTTRVLWWDGPWIEATTNLQVSSMGVQFWGAPQIGWARVLFDGVEAWRGIASALGSKHGIYGGYVEVSGFSPGVHTIRAESVGLDYRPVTVAAFGFSYQGGVESEAP